MLGFVSAMLGRKAVMAYAAAVETVVLRHLEEQLVAMEAVGDLRAYEALEAIVEDEREHRNHEASEPGDCVFYRPFTIVIKSFMLEMDDIRVLPIMRASTDDIIRPLSSEGLVGLAMSRLELRMADHGLDLLAHVRDPDHELTMGHGYVLMFRWLIGLPWRIRNRRTWRCLKPLRRACYEHRYVRYLMSWRGHGSGLLVLYDPRKYTNAQVRFLLPDRSRQST